MAGKKIREKTLKEMTNTELMMMFVYSKNISAGGVDAVDVLAEIRRRVEG